MIKYQCKLLLASLLFVFSSAGHADVSDESVNKLLELSGLTEQVGQFPELIKAGMEQAKQPGSPISDAEYTFMLSSINEAFVPEKITHAIGQSVKASMTQTEANQLLAWYESDAGRAITDAEESASTPEAYQQMMASAPSLLKKTDLVQTAKRIDVLLNATETTLQAQEQSSLAVYLALMTAIQPDTAVDIAPFKAEMAAQKSQMQTEIQNMVVVSLVYAYQNVDPQNLQKYEAFLSDATTAKFHQVVLSSMSKAFESGAGDWGRTLGQHFKHKQN
jgi:hypothetical protein